MRYQNVQLLSVLAISVEVAGVLNALGSDTHLFVRKDRPLRTFDKDIIDVLVDEMAKSGPTLHTHANATEVVKNADDSLTISFDNGETRLYDARPLLQPGTVFASFREWRNFRRVYLDENHCVSWDIDPAVDSTKVWNNKVDLSPDDCYVDSTPLPGSLSA